MKYSVVNKNKIRLEDRIDAEYFEPALLSVSTKLEEMGGIPLSNFCSITASAFYPAATELYESGDMPFIRVSDCIDYPAITKHQLSTLVKIPTSFLRQNKNIKSLKTKDIVISKVGTPCYASLVYDIEEVALSRTVLGLRNIKDIDPSYLLAFLRSRYGYGQLLRERELTIQLQLTLDRTARILVVAPSRDFQRLIDLVINLYITSQYKAIDSYGLAENRVEKTVMPDEFKLPANLTYTSLFSRTNQANRLDAEYHHPKYEAFINQIKRNKHRRLGDLANVIKSIEVGSAEYKESGIPFVRVSNISRYGITTNNQQYISDELYNELKRYQPKQGEVLLTKDGTPGIAYHLRDSVDKMLLSGGLLRIGLKSNDVLPEYLTLVLNSTLVQKQIERDAGGSIIVHWLVDQIKDTLIPLLDITEQKEIVTLITNSFELRDNASKLLDIAKTGVEMAIDESEKSATYWINKQLEKHNINYITQA